MQKLLSILFLFLSATLYSQTYVFLGSYNGDKNKPGIYVYELDITSGALEHVTEVKDVFNPSYLTLSPDGKFLYACTDTRVPKGGDSKHCKDSSRKRTKAFYVPSKWEIRVLY